MFFLIPLINKKYLKLLHKTNLYKNNILFPNKKIDNFN